MKLFILTFSILFLASCGMTQEEKLQAIKDCKELGYGYYLNNSTNEVRCDTYPKDKVSDCIRGYINSIDEKYNNPDTVSNLREDDYSKVVKTCQETFGEKTSTPLQ